jgi:hypothetical protein
MCNQQAGRLVMTSMTLVTCDTPLSDIDLTPENAASRPTKNRKQKKLRKGRSTTHSARHARHGGRKKKRSKKQEGQKRGGSKLVPQTLCTFLTFFRFFSIQHIAVPVKNLSGPEIICWPTFSYTINFDNLPVVGLT